uniref:Uncharacterized protein n=1 Tax=Arundo donax TaxID=35708 RepID=A0A0A8ZA77_ARUDO
MLRFAMNDVVVVWINPHRGVVVHLPQMDENAMLDAALPTVLWHFSNFQGGG